MKKALQKDGGEKYVTVLGASILVMAGFLLSAYLHPAWLLATAGLSAALAGFFPNPLRKQC